MDFQIGQTSKFSKLRLYPWYHPPGSHWHQTLDLLVPLENSAKEFGPFSGGKADLAGHRGHSHEDPGHFL